MAWRDSSGREATVVHMTLEMKSDIKAAVMKHGKKHPELRSINNFVRTACKLYLEYLKEMGDESERRVEDVPEGTPETKGRKR